MTCQGPKLNATFSSSFVTTHFFCRSSFFLSRCSLVSSFLSLYAQRNPKKKVQIKPKKCHEKKGTRCPPGRCLSSPPSVGRRPQVQKTMKLPPLDSSIRSKHESTFPFFTEKSTNHLKSINQCYRYRTGTGRTGRYVPFRFLNGISTPSFRFVICSVRHRSNSSVSSCFSCTARNIVFRSVPFSSSYAVAFSIFFLFCLHTCQPIIGPFNFFHSLFHFTP